MACLLIVNQVAQQDALQNCSPRPTVVH